MSRPPISGSLNAPLSILVVLLMTPSSGHRAVPQSCEDDQLSPMISTSLEPPVKSGHPSSPKQEPAYESSYVRWIIALFCLGWAVVYADRTVLYPILNVIGLDFGLSGSQAGAITSVYFLVYVAMQLPAGILGDWLGLKPVLVVTYLLAAIGLLAVGIAASDYTSLLLFVAMYALGAGAYHPIAFSITMGTVPVRLRGLSSAIINSGMSLGLVLGLGISGPVYLATSSWQFVFALLAVPTFLLALVFALTVRPSERRRSSTVALPIFLKNRSLVCLYAANFCSLYGFWTAITWGPSFFQTERGISLGLSGLYTAIVALSGVPAALAIGYVSDRWSRKKLSLTLFPLAALALLSMATVNTLPSLVIVLLLYGLVGKLAWEPLAVAWAADHVHVLAQDAMGAGLGLFGAIGMSSAIIAPVAAGWLLDKTDSLQAAFYLAAVVLLVGFFCLWATRDMAHEAKAAA